MGGVSHAGSGGEALQLAHRAQIEPKLDALAKDLGEHCLSDFSFSNLYLFRAAHDYRFHPGPWPGLSGRTYDAQTHFFPLFNARHAPVAVLEGLLARFDCLYPLAACHLPELHHRHWQLTASRDDADYLYPAAQFIAYRGRRLQKKRNLMRQLTSMHRIASVPLQGAMVGQALVLLDLWLRYKGKLAGDADDAPCREALAHLRAFGFEGRLYLADDQPAGFLLAQPLAGRFLGGAVRQGQRSVQGHLPAHVPCVRQRAWAACDLVELRTGHGPGGFSPGQAELPAGCPAAQVPIAC